MKNPRKPPQIMPATSQNKKEHMAHRKQPERPEHSAEHDAPAKRAQPHHDVALMRLRSLRWRIMLGAVLWTLGLLPVGHMLFLVLTGGGHDLWRLAGVFHGGLSITL